MPVFRSEVELLDAAGQPLGHGMLYLHLPRGLDRPQEGAGTVSLRSWTSDDAAPVSARLQDGRTLPLEVSRSALSDCSQNRILRFRTSWAGGSRGTDAVLGRQSPDAQE